jgi:hypothetical protein
VSQPEMQLYSRAVVLGVCVCVCVCVCVPVPVSAIQHC